ncbi:hypothetical protein BWI17_17720 [Betaproteobacteria bacterium GR16-43]|nr:hypothetical protein BWI17_17720 [Betaproteobacteria bacterium GR16-43]
MTAGALAQTSPTAPLATTIEQRTVVVAADGRERLEAGDAVRPGAVVEYTVTLRNTTSQGLKNVQATLPIPASTEYLPGSARPAAITGSADGTTYSVLPIRRTVKKNGVEVTETLGPRDVRWVRWAALDLAGGASATFTARVRVDK